MALDIYTITIFGFLVGFVADVLLNIVTRNFGKSFDTGLKDYYIVHGNLEAAFIAAGLVGFTTWISLWLWEKFMGKSLGQINKWYTMFYLIVIGVILDSPFRYLHLMPTLDKMYATLPDIVTMAGNCIALVGGFVLALVWEYFRK